MPSTARSPSALSAPRRFLYATLTVLLSTVLALLVAEAGLRLWHGGLRSEPPHVYSGLPLEFFRSSYPAVYDPVLGYRPEPGAAGRENPWHTVVTITREGYRSNGTGGGALAGRPILAVGDSFTFGDEVSDGETWPAFIERMLHRPVLNAGVFGYGLDQMVLRAERILKRARPAMLIVSITPGDVLRCEFSYRYAWKPYFDLEGGALVLRNVPVPPPGTLSPGEGWLPRLLRASHLANLVVQRLDPDRWAIPEAIRVHRRGLAVSRKLVDRLARLGRARGIPVLFVAQWVPGPDHRPAQALVARARADGIDALDLEDPLLRLLPEELDEVVRWRTLYNVTVEGELLRVGHMNPRGNEAVARLIAAEVKRRLGETDR